jgi:hypothetical protein
MTIGIMMIVRDKARKPLEVCFYKKIGGKRTKKGP